MKKKYFLSLIVFLIATYLGLSSLLFHTLSQVPEPNIEREKNTPRDFQITYAPFADVDVSEYQGMPYETLIIQKENRQLSAWSIGGLKNKESIILVHGLGESKGVAPLLILASALYKEGYQVLVMDLRNHGQSTKLQNRHSMGIQESKDIKTMIHYLQSLGIDGENIGLYGRSLGGASSLIAFLETPKIKAAVLDSAFTDHIKLIKTELKKSKVPPFLLWGGLFAGKNFFRVNLLEKNIFSLLEQKETGALFLIHGHKDTVIPISHSKDLKARIEKEKKLSLETWFHDYPGHSDSMFHSPKKNSDKVISFFNRQLKRK